MEDHGRAFDVIVVGAGPAGLSAAYVLARSGFHVAVVERGRGAGSKQVFGGRVYSKPLRMVFGSLGDAPIHRWVTRERISIMDDERMLTMEYASRSRSSFITYLTQLVSWMAGKAVEAGAVLVDEVRVDGILADKGRVIGIEAGGDRLMADVVIDAEGANRILLEKLGLVGKPRPSHMALGVKEVVKLGEKNIEDRFGLSRGEGLAWIIAGFPPGTLGGFIYTNKDTVSIGIIAPLSYEGLGEEPYRFVERLRLHPELRKLWIDGDIVEYSAHLVPEKVNRLVPSRLALSGLLVVGDAAGLLLNTGYTVRGVDYAAYSGYLAAKAVVEAHGKYGSYEGEVLRKLYEEKLRRSVLFRDLARHRLVEMALEQPRMLSKYPAVLLDTAERIYELGLETPTLLDSLRSSLRKHGVSLPRMLWDALRGVMKA